MTRYLYPLTVVLALAPIASMAEPRPISGGIICDTLEDAQLALQGERPPSCGVLKIPFPAEVTFLDTFVIRDHEFQLARYDFVVPVPWGVQTQYGWWGKPELLDTSL